MGCDHPNGRTPSGQSPIHFVAAEPLTAPRGFGAGTLRAERAHRVVALVLHPTGQPELRMLLNPLGALALAAQLTAAAERLAGGPGHG